MPDRAFDAEILNEPILPMPEPWYRDAPPRVVPKGCAQCPRCQSVFNPATSGGKCFACMKPGKARIMAAKQEGDRPSRFLMGEIAGMRKLGRMAKYRVKTGRGGSI